MNDAAGSRARRVATASRLAAVQALYQVDREEIPGGIATGNTTENIIAGAVINGAMLDESGRSAAIDGELVALIVRNATADSASLDGMLDEALSEGWSVGRLESLMRAILRAGLRELMDCPDVPARVVISDYVDIAHAFYDRGEPGMVNAVLDRLARVLRSREFSGEAATDA